jgi:hypothetical protein
MTRQWIAALLPGTARPARPTRRATIGVLVMAVCALMSLGAVASAHPTTDHVYAALGDASVAGPSPDAAGDGGVQDNCAGGGGVGDD